MRIYNRSEIKQSVQLDREVLDAVEDAFSKLQAGQVEMPPIMRVDIPEHRGEVDVKTAYVHGWDSFAIKVSSGFFHNAKLGLPSGNGMMLLLSAVTGIPEAVLLDNGYLTDVRTAAAGAVAAKYLAPEHVETAGVIGAGTQARYQVMALRQVRHFQRLVVYGPTAERVQQFAREMETRLNVHIVRAETPEEVVRESDVVVTATPASEPIVKAEWLHPGLHITAMGSDAEHKQELEDEVLQRADVCVCDVKAQCVELGELHHVWTHWDDDRKDSVVELGELTTGKTPGRTGDRQVTVCDLTGTGVQDTAIARLALRKLERNIGLGIHVN